MQAGQALRRLSGGVRRASLGLLDALLPPRCLACEDEVEAQGTLCAACFVRLTPITEPFCGHCGVPFIHEAQVIAEDGTTGLCERCRRNPPSFLSARAAFRYDDGARRLILPFKHGDRTDLALPLARHMARAGAALLARADVIAPVPAHWWRLVRRRYDQSALLARALGRLAGRPAVPDLLRRTRRTPPLADKGAAERAVTVEGAFAVPLSGRALVAGRQVLLVDDVMTSGATAEACTLALLDAGARGVDVLAAARVPDPRLRDA